MNRLVSCCFVLSFWAGASMAAEPCAQDFSSFLSIFERSRTFQIQNTRFPLSATYVDIASVEEPKTVTYTIESSSDPKYARVIYPSDKDQRAIPLEASISPSQGQLVVQLTKPDTDYSLAYRFEKTASCWRLVRFDDDSL